MKGSFSISEAEHQWLLELSTWLRIGGIDDSPDRRAFLHSVLFCLLKRFENGLRDGSVEYMPARELLKFQLEESVVMLQAAE